MKFTIFLLCSLLISKIQAQTILLDPGHGGKDCGAKSYISATKKTKPIKVCEKDIALSISKRVKDYLPKNYQVYLTRTIDRDVSLQERALMADKVKADLFISIHLNGSSSKKSHGFETFYLDNHNDIAIKKIEQVENGLLEKSETVINQILIDLVIERTAPQSKKLAYYIHKNINYSVKKKFKLKDRGIKKALFYVLALSKRPSVLIEAGFITHKRERDQMLSKKFQNQFARAVAKGIVRYFKKKPSPPIF